MEFEGVAVKRLHAVGVNPSTLGSSGTLARKLSNFSLNASTDTLEIFLMVEQSRMEGEPFKGGNTASLPLLSLCRTFFHKFYNIILESGEIMTGYKTRELVSSED